MFSIGLFSTHIPYLVLAMIYGLYIGVHTVMKAEQAGELPGQENHEISYNPQNTLEDNSTKAFYYQDYFTDTAESIAMRPGVPIEYILRDKIPIRRDWISSNLFSRPPPLV